MGTIKSIYGQAFRTHLGYHPVWTPGTRIIPGDIGYMKDGLFAREGHITQLVSTVRPRLFEATIPAPMKFSVGSRYEAGAAGHAKGGAVANANATLHFSAEGGAVFHAADIVQNGIDNLHEILEAIPWNTDAVDGGLVFVSEVHMAKTAAALVAIDGSVAASLSGKVKALQALDIADASVDFEASSAAAYDVHLRKGPTPHPVALRLYHKPRSILPTRPKLLGVVAIEQETLPPGVEEISPYDIG